MFREHQQFGAHAPDGTPAPRRWPATEDLKVFRSRATVTSQHPVMVQSDVGEGRLIPEHNRAVVTALSLILLHSGS